MSPRSASQMPKQAWRAQETSHYHRGEFQTHAFHVVPFIGPLCLSHEFTWSEKHTLEKQTSRHATIMPD